MHLTNGLYDARIDQSPVVAITGVTYHDVIGTHYLQDINHDFALNDACVYSQRIMGEAHVLNLVDMAIRSAIGSRGPTAIAFPIDIQSGEAVTGDRSIKNVALILTDGFSCRSQIEHGTERSALHLSQVVQMALREGPNGPSLARPEQHYAGLPG